MKNEKKNKKKADNPPLYRNLRTVKEKDLYTTQSDITIKKRIDNWLFFQKLFIQVTISPF